MEEVCKKQSDDEVPSTGGRTHTPAQPKGDELKGVRACSVAHFGMRLQKSVRVERIWILVHARVALDCVEVEDELCAGREVVAEEVGFAC